jgi:hypothetical protein
MPGMKRTQERINRKGYKESTPKAQSLLSAFLAVFFASFAVKYSL